MNTKITDTELKIFQQTITNHFYYRTINDLKNYIENLSVAQIASGPLFQLDQLECYIADNNLILHDHEWKVSCTYPLNDQIAGGWLFAFNQIINYLERKAAANHHDNAKKQLGR